LAAYTADLVESRLPVRLAGLAAAERVGGPVARRLEAVVERSVLSGSRRSLDYVVCDATPEASRLRLLRTLAQCHNDLAAPRTAWAAGVAGPVTILILGALVGLIAIALFLPLVKITTGLV
jgi:hypothetical protein